MSDSGRAGQQRTAKRTTAKAQSVQGLKRRAGELQATMTYRDPVILSCFCVSWQFGQKYVVRWNSPCRIISMRVAHTKQGWPRRRYTQFRIHGLSCSYDGRYIDIPY